jgi:hypothetical protein
MVKERKIKAKKELMVILDLTIAHLEMRMKISKNPRKNMQMMKKISGSMAHQEQMITNQI